MLPESVLVAAIADGAGSAPLGGVGAAIAARMGVEAIGTRIAQQWRPASDEYWKLLLKDALKAARMAIEVEATAREVAMRDLATTLR
ncbi:MAG: protein phosphatase 2C domain-containing protein, partial [Candidatus Tectomicrobia bacterium]|nr:protein phosphatase 2C domain-containing protein [Candidatus Tectomicrobia bacterium]